MIRTFDHYIPTRILLTAAAVFLSACSSTTVNPPDGQLRLGTWGGANAGVVATDSITHVHVACTFGDIPGRITLDTDGRFSVAGSFVLRAYPVMIGPSVPAQFSGQVRGNTLTMSVAVNDTVDKKQVSLGPITVILGAAPQMGPCPICAVPRLRR